MTPSFFCLLTPLISSLSLLSSLNVSFPPGMKNESTVKASNPMPRTVETTIAAINFSHQPPEWDSSTSKSSLSSIILQQLLSDHSIIFESTLSKQPSPLLDHEDAPRKRGRKVALLPSSLAGKHQKQSLKINLIKKGKDPYRFKFILSIEFILFIFFAPTLKDQKTSIKQTSIESASIKQTLDSSQRLHQETGCIKPPPPPSESESSSSSRTPCSNAKKPRVNRLSKPLTRPIDPWPAPMSTNSPNLKLQVRPL